MYNEMLLNNHYVESVWHFYSAYSMCVSIVGFNDKLMNKKNSLMKSLLKSLSNGKFDFSIYNKLVSHINKDMKIIEMAVRILEKKKEDGDFFGDTYQRGMFAVSLYD